MVKTVHIPYSSKMDTSAEIKNEHFTNPLGYKVSKFNEWYMSAGFQDLRGPIFELEVREQDVLVASFPKSGTTWVQEMVWMIINNLNFEEGKGIEIDVRSPFLELSKLYSFDNLNQENLIPHVAQNSLAHLTNRMENEFPLVIKTHLPLQFLPKQIQEGTKKPKIVYITRNPKDVCVSYYYHCQRINGYIGGFETFCNLFLNGKLKYCPFWSNVLSYLRRTDLNILFITYEEMIDDLPSVIRKISKFLGKPLNDEQVSNLADHLSFENMKKNPAVNKTSLHSWLKPFNKEMPEFIRTGRTGSFKEHMSPEMIRRFDDWITENTKGTDLMSRIQIS